MREERVVTCWVTQLLTARGMQRTCYELLCIREKGYRFEGLQKQLCWGFYPGLLQL